MRIIGDLLDKQLIDRSGFKAGRVDGIVLEWDSAGGLRATHLESGPITLADRLSTRLGRLVTSLVRRYSEHYGAIRIPVSQVLEIGVNVKVDLSAPESGLLTFERWLSKNIIAKIPGG